MKKKWIAAFLSLIMFCCLLVVPTQKVKALTWGIPYKAIVTEPKTVYWYSFYAPNWKEHKGHPKTLPVGKLITITRHYGFGTMVTGKGMAHHSTIDKETFWMAPSYSRSWYDVYAKHTLLDTGLFHGAKKRTNKSYSLTWKQYCRLVRMRLWDLTDKPYSYSLAHNLLKQINAWGIKPE